tara:strand:+ start:166 stop:369 length:204 start_codon:yes stop_codon:yes gene_type:complete
MTSEKTRRAIKETYLALKELGYEFQCRKVLYSRRGFVVDVYCPCCEEDLERVAEKITTHKTNFTQKD